MIFGTLTFSSVPFASSAGASIDEIIDYLAWTPVCKMAYIGVEQTKDVRAVRECVGSSIPAPVIPPEVTPTIPITPLIDSLTSDYLVDSLTTDYLVES